MQDVDLQPVDIQPEKTRKRRLIVSIACVLLVVLLAIGAALFVRYYVVTTFIVDGISMYPTLDGGGGANPEYGDTEEERAALRTNGELLYLNRLAKIGRGDIVVFKPVGWGLSSEGSDIAVVKRVIAIGGDRVQIVDNIVFVNGDALREPYINENADMGGNLDLIVPDGEIFCMGDNRSHSSDSRTFGTVSLDNVIGRCFLIKGLDGKLRKP